MRIINLSWIALVAACGGSGAGQTEAPPAAEATAAPEAAAQTAGPATGFTIVENGRDVITPGADGTFKMDGPEVWTLRADGELRRAEEVVLRRDGDAIKKADGTVVATVTAGRLTFPSGDAIEVGDDGAITVVDKPSGGETFQVRGLNPDNRVAVFSLIAWMMVGS